MDRSLNDIDKVLNLAKLDKNDLKPVSQALYFTNASSINKYKLLQLNSKLEQQLKQGESVYINGERDDYSYICTECNTFEVIHSETSNSLLLSDNLKFNENLKNEDERDCSKVFIEGIFHDYVEVVQKQPNFDTLQEILEKTAYKGPENEYQFKEEDFYNFDELWSKIPSSKVELQAVLNDLHAITWNNKIRILDFEYNFRVLSYMLNLIDENSWALDQIDFQETMNALEDLVPIEILNSVFEFYTEESDIIDGIQLYRYKEYEVCRTLAQVLLHSAGRFNLREFLQAWQDSVPEGMHTEENMLNGIAIIDRNSKPNVIFSFTERNLPKTIVERLKVLFSVKEKWTLPEIAPYVKTLATENLDVNALLVKYARSSKMNGIQYYSSKHGK